MTRTDRTFALRRTRLTDASGRPVEDDCCVIEDGETIGRIYKSVGFRDQEWFWATLRFPSSGNQSGWVASLEEAKAAFKIAWGLAAAR